MYEQSYNQNAVNVFIVPFGLIFLLNEHFCIQETFSAFRNMGGKIHNYQPYFNIR
jgi:hypothetical protein